MAELPTVRVRNWKPGVRSIGIINQQDFDPRVHELVEDEEDEAVEQATPVETELKSPQRRRKASGG